VSDVRGHEKRVGSAVGAVGRAVGTRVGPVGIAVGTLVGDDIEQGQNMCPDQSHQSLVV